MNDTKYFELLGRLTELEKRVEALEGNKVSGASMLVDTPEQYVATKKWNKNEVIEEIKQQASKHNIKIRKASMVEGAGVIVEDSNKKVMLRRSRDYAISNHLQDEFNFSGWSTVTDEEMKRFDAYIFAVHQNNDIHFFIFDDEQMKAVKNDKVNDSQGRYHFYIAQTREGKYIDHREDTVIDLNKFYNNWNILKGGN
ncbi:hypothetical protein [Macrococcoides canis]|uniref:hypothetical protein n=1 Tax=Macrococcoides canis TaxID=1855823 RepID=UPI00165EA68E|nr:hypothetical protein [Macrococcus canis]QNR09098.1 hypothetical protein GL258_12495 [Macrococcus canis]